MLSKLEIAKGVVKLSDLSFLDAGNPRNIHYCGSLGTKKCYICPFGIQAAMSQENGNCSMLAYRYAMAHQEKIKKWKNL